MITKKGTFKAATFLLIAWALLVSYAMGLTLAALASDITNAEYRTTITFTNADETATGVAGTWSLNTTDMIDGNMLAANASDAALLSGGIDVAFMPSANDTFPWCAWITTIAEDADLSMQLMSGNVSGGGIRYFAGAAGMSASDSASLEAGDNFTIEQKGFVDTTQVGANLINKDAAFKTYISGSENITSVLIGIGGGGSETLRPDGVGDYTGIHNVEGAATHWEAVDEVIADNATSFVQQDTSGATEMEHGTDFYQLEDTALAPNTVINSVTVHFNFCGYENGGLREAKAIPMLRLNSANVSGTEETHYYTYYEDESEVLSRPTGGDWTVADLNSLQVGWEIYKGNDVDGAGRYSQIYVVIDYDESLVVTASGVSSGEHEIATTANVTHLAIYIDDVLENSVALTANVTDNSENWTFAEGDAMPYLEYHTVTINGTVKQNISWQYATTFTDSSGYSNDAVPTFRTAPSDADITGAATAQEGIIGTTSPTAANVSGGWTLLDETPTAPEGLFTEGSDSYGVGDFNIGERITTAAEDAYQDATTWHYIVAFGLSTLFFALAYGASHKTRTGRRGSLMLAVFVAAIPLIFFYREGTIFGWLLIPYGLLELFLIAWRRSPSPVD